MLSRDRTANRATEERQSVAEGGPMASSLTEERQSRAEEVEADAKPALINHS